jgi:hypothetical protein
VSRSRNDPAGGPPFVVPLPFAEKTDALNVQSRARPLRKGRALDCHGFASQ